MQVTEKKDGRVGSPCGACREMMMQLDKNGGDIEILVSLHPRRTVTLGELMADWRGKERFASCKEEAVSVGTKENK